MRRWPFPDVETGFAEDAAESARRALDDVVASKAGDAIRRDERYRRRRDCHPPAYRTARIDDTREKPAGPFGNCTFALAERYY